MLPVQRNSNMLLGDVSAFSYGPEFGRIIKMSHANHKSKAAQAVRSPLYAHDPNPEFKPDTSLQTCWHVCEVNMAISHLGTMCSVWIFAWRIRTVLALA